MKRLITIFVLGLSLIPGRTRGQDRTMEVDQLFEMVMESHPIALQAELFIARGELSVRESRGGFDPKLVSSFDKKEFTDVNYYQVWDSYLEIPTRLNIDFIAGYEQNNGLFLNPENSVPSNGLPYLGVSVPLGQGLIHNQRNLNLQKGKVSQLNLENQAVIVLNNLFLDANFSYWNWYESYFKKQLADQNVELIAERYEGIRQSVFNGESASIDSTETLIQVQEWSNRQAEANLKYDNSILQLFNFIWGDSLKVEELAPKKEPRLDPFVLDNMLDDILGNHPLLQDLILEANTLDLDRKLAQEQIKPVLDINYNVLLAETEGDMGNLSNNYTIGFDFAFPILIRKERAKLKTIKLKVQENKLKTEQKYRDLLTKIQRSYNKVYTIQNLILQQRVIIQNYTRMLEAEQIKFDNGESSVFLLNTRENKKLEAEIKMIELNAKYGIAIGELKWAAGVITPGRTINN